jgi:hypothetical protein
MERGLRRLTIEVNGAQDPIAGQLIDERGASLPFSGWLGLASGLERLLGPGRGPGGSLGGGSVAGAAPLRGATSVEGSAPAGGGLEG